MYIAIFCLSNSDCSQLGKMFYVEVYCGHMIVHMHAVSLGSKHNTCSVTNMQKGRDDTNEGL